MRHSQADIALVTLPPWQVDLTVPFDRIGFNKFSLKDHVVWKGTFSDGQEFTIGGRIEQIGRRSDTGAFVYKVKIFNRAIPSRWIEEENLKGMKDDCKTEDQRRSTD